MSYRLIVFDLDGTLVDSLPDLRTAVNLALSEHDYPTRTLAEVREAIGDGARLLVARCLPPGTPDPEIDRVWNTFRARYLECCLDGSRLLPGAAEFLEARSRDPEPPRMAILTNKPQAPTDRLVKHFGLDRWIRRALGGDTPMGRKPDPAGLRGLMTESDATPATTLVVGDGPADLAVARAAGADAILLADGYGRRDELDALPRLREVRGMAELGRIWSELG